MKAEPQKPVAPQWRDEKNTSTRLKPLAQAMHLLNLELPAQRLATPAIERRFYRCTPQA